MTPEIPDDAQIGRIWTIVEVVGPRAITPKFGCVPTRLCRDRIA